MKGKTVVITGGTSGIGEIAAEALARMGARIILVARSRSRADATLTRLRESGPNVTHSVYFADLARLAEMKRVAAEIAMREPPIDVLINNAGALFGARRLTDDGLEYTFALNHMSYFVVTEGLRERTLGLRRHCNAVVNYDDDCLNGEKCRHSGQDDPDLRKRSLRTVRIIGWKATVTSLFRVFLFVFLSAPLHRHQRQRQGA